VAKPIFRHSQFRGEAKSFGRSSICNIYNIVVTFARRAGLKKLAIPASSPYARAIIGFGSAADA
jgi:hypothetical protein